MAFLDRHSAPNRGPILLAIGALHAGVIYALATGLAGYVPILDPLGRTVAVNVPLPQPPPDPPDRQRERTKATGAEAAHRGETVFTVQATKVELNDRTEVRVDLGTGDGGAFPPPDPQPSASADPARPPALARPIGRPAQWVTVNDYPTAELSAGHQGVTRFRLSIGADGKVQGCEITESSGFARLDQAACANLRKRARFVAATDAGGAAAPGIYASAVRWEIPKN